MTIEHQRPRKLVLSTIIEPACLIDWMNDSKASRINTPTYYCLSKQTPDEILLIAMVQYDPTKPNPIFGFVDSSRMSCSLADVAVCPTFIFRTSTLLGLLRESVEVRTPLIV